MSMMDRPGVNQAVRDKLREEGEYNRLRGLTSVAVILRHLEDVESVPYGISDSPKQEPQLLAKLLSEALDTYYRRHE